MSKVSDGSKRASVSSSGVQKAAQEVVKGKATLERVKKPAVGGKFARDEMSTGRGSARLKAAGKAVGLREGTLKVEPLAPGILKKLGFKLDSLLPNLSDDFKAEGLGKAIKGQFFDQLNDMVTSPLPASQSPHQNKDGSWVAPNGDKLLTVSLGNGHTALVDPKTNSYYTMEHHQVAYPDLKCGQGQSSEGVTFHGPHQLPEGSRFEEKDFSAARIKELQQWANRGMGFPGLNPILPLKPQHHGGPLPLPLHPGGIQFPGLPMDPGTIKALKALGLGTLSFKGKAPAPGNVASETVIKNQHPLTWSVIHLKDDPHHVIIKQVLTGGFVPVRPGDGSYSAPIPV